MTQPHLIALTGPAGCGKDTVRAYLQEHGYHGLAFADPIRTMLQALLQHIGAPPEHMTERHLKERPIPGLGLSYRQLAQTLGTEWGRALSGDLWVRIAQQRIASLYGDNFTPMRIVISDVRFPNEADWVRAQGGQVWHIVRPGIDPVRPHASEAGVPLHWRDCTIHNTGTLADLRQAVASALAAWQQLGKAMA